MSELEICALADIPEGGARGYEVVDGGVTRQLILTRSGATVRAYLNSCPHTGVRLDWRRDDFLDVSGRYLQCATHGALFEPGTGRCVAGPCAGSGLIAAASRVDAAGAVFVRDPSVLPDSAMP
jgi:nitrite reductase/ring-hydroxylating ferredoxin subunit